MSKNLNQPELIQLTGPWPFTTRRIYRRADNFPLVWESRHHRKHLHRFKLKKFSSIVFILRKCWWMPRQLNWWIGVVFAIGSLLFMLGSVLSLIPTWAKIWSLNATEINAIFFAGSIPFTTSAYLQLFQAANSREFLGNSKESPHRVIWFGWHPRDIGWLSCALQFLGTILFNFNTFDAMLPDLNWLQQDLVIWIPDVLGSVLFLASGYLAFIETCHAYWAWKPTSISWWVTFINLLGCIAFMISALLAFVPPQLPNANVVNISITFTFIGALCFLMGSLLMLPETAMSE